MSIRVRCQCGRVYAAGSHVAGKTARCKVCGATVHIPDDSTQRSDPVSTEARDGGGGATDREPEVYGLAGGSNEPTSSCAQRETGGLSDSIRRCPNCSVTMAENAILCVQCGYNLHTGKQVVSHVNESPGSVTNDHCPHCGAELVGHSTSCAHCGFVLTRVPSDNLIADEDVAEAHVELSLWEYYDELFDAAADAVEERLPYATMLLGVCWAVAITLVGIAIFVSPGAIEWWCFTAALIAASIPTVEYRQRFAVKLVCAFWFVAGNLAAIAFFLPHGAIRMIFLSAAGLAMVCPMTVIVSFAWSIATLCLLSGICFRASETPLPRGRDALEVMILVGLTVTGITLVYWATYLLVVFGNRLLDNGSMGVAYTFYLLICFMAEANLFCRITSVGKAVFASFLMNCFPWVLWLVLRNAGIFLFLTMTVAATIAVVAAGTLRQFGLRARLKVFVWVVLALVLVPVAGFVLRIVQNSGDATSVLTR